MEGKEGIRTHCKSDRIPTVSGILIKELKIEIKSEAF